MTLCSYEYQSEIRYDYRVLHAQIDLMERGLEFQQDQQRKLYKGGVHFCPTCAGQELRNLGQSEEAAWLLDRSAILRTDTNEKVMDVLHRFNLYSNGDAAPRLKMLFECQARPSERYPKGRNARYVHLKGEGHNCDRSEHEIVIRRIGNAFLNSLRERYPDLQAKVEFENKIDTVNRKPDIRLQLLDDQGVIINDTAIELQKSAIAVETFLRRTQDMQKVLSGVVWVFKKSQIKGRFLNIAREALRRQIPIFSYEIKGEAYSDDQDIYVSEITEADLPEEKPLLDGPKTVHAEPCKRAEVQTQFRGHLRHQTRVSSLSNVILDYSRPTLFETIVPPKIRFATGAIAWHGPTGKRVQVKRLQGNIAVCRWLDEMVPLSQCYWPVALLTEADWPLSLE